MTAILKSTRTATSWDPSDKEFVEDLRQILKTPDGKNATNPRIFLLAMSIGFSKGVKGEKPPRANDAARLEYLREDEVGRMRLIAIHDAESSEILESDEDVIDIAEQYAHGGLVLLRAEKETNPAFLDWLVAEMYKQTRQFTKNGAKAGGGARSGDT